VISVTTAPDGAQRQLVQARSRRQQTAGTLNPAQALVRRFKRSLEQTPESR
jgi:hypothetical protein